MTVFLDRHGLSCDSRLARFVEDRALPGTGLDADRFWADFAALLARFAPENAALLARREALQAKIDAWHETRAGQPHDAAAYEAYLREIGYLVPAPADRTSVVAGKRVSVRVDLGGRRFIKKK